MQPARYCRPSSRSASDSMNGASATSRSASAIASDSGCEYTSMKLERVLTRVNISTAVVHIWNGKVRFSRVLSGVLRPCVAADRAGGCASWTFSPDTQHERFGLSELARRFGLSKPTCLGIVTALTDAGYLVRDASGQDLPAGPVADHPRPQGTGVDAGQSGGPRGTAPAVGALRCHRGAVGCDRRPDHAAGPGGAGRRAARRRGRPELPVRTAGRADVRAVGRRGGARTGSRRSRRSRCAPRPTGSTG